VTIYTIGHSTRPLAVFVDLLRAHGITKLADVRTVPKSRRHPHFAADALARSLREAGVAYRHMPALGGLRKPRADSRNTAWRHDGFRGYADHMETAAFQEAIDELMAWAGGDERPGADQRPVPAPAGTKEAAARILEAPGRVAIMCAEAVWWRCHRQLIADALVVRGVAVRHIMSPTSAPTHTLTDFARIENGRVVYPGLI
jgi:uncharacterized protein (DUF488 family)